MNDPKDVAQILTQKNWPSFGTARRHGIFYYTNGSTYNPETRVTEHTITGVELARPLVTGFTRLEINGDAIKSTDVKILLPFLDLNVVPDENTFMYDGKGNLWGLCIIKIDPLDVLHVLRGRKSKLAIPIVTTYQHVTAGETTTDVQVIVQDYSSSELNENVLGGDKKYLIEVSALDIVPEELDKIPYPDTDTTVVVVSVNLVTIVSADRSFEKTYYELQVR